MSRRALVAAWCAAVIVAGVALVALALVLGGGAPPPAPPGPVRHGPRPSMDRFDHVVRGRARRRRDGWIRPPGQRIARSSVAGHAHGRGRRRRMVGVAHDLPVRPAVVGAAGTGRCARHHPRPCAVAATAAGGRGRRLLVARAHTTGCADRDDVLVGGVVADRSRRAPDVRRIIRRSPSCPCRRTSWAPHSGWVASPRSDGLPRSGTREWGAALPRYSRLALVCVVVLTLSGVLTSALRLNSLAELVTSRYGAIVTFKVVLLTGLVVAGWLQRRYVFVGTPMLRRHFLLVAALELTTMTMAFAARRGAGPHTRRRSEMLSPAA